MAPKGKQDQLAEYRRKRSADQTPEPFADGAAPQPGLFVVQKHAASHMHYDLRLELHGALLSWAVPKGPSFDPEVKRLAMEVEEHPLEYADFEGIIPAGNYGAGAVVVWDKGLWIPVEDPAEGMKKGKLLFDLRGYKLRGRWTLFRTSKGKPNEWLMMKKPDAYANPANPPGEESIHSGLTVEELRDGVDRAARIRRRLKKLKTPTGDLRIQKLELMLAQPEEQAFSKPGWIFELKYDGYRLLGENRDGKPRLRYRRGNDVTELFPEIAKALKALPYSLILDGEVVVLDDDGKPSFQALQQRVHLGRTADIARATVRWPATLFVFDVPAFEGFDLRGLPLLERKKVLLEVLPKAGPLRYCDHIEEQGEAMYEEVRRMRLEGVVAKRADSKYRAGRSADWIKIRADRTGDFVIVGYSPARGTRSGFGALHLAVCEGGDFVYAGRVGSGFTTRQLKELHAELEQIRRDEPPCTGPIPTAGDHVWVEPRWVCEVRYKEWTGAAHLRQPVFLSMREDKPVEDCVREGGASAPHAPSSAVVRTPGAEREHSVSFTNLKKVFWPEEGYTKGDLIDYYRKISPWIMPYLEDRPLVLTRYPDGIHGKNFFQKDAPGFVSEWIRTEKMWSEHAQREIHYFVCDSPDSLLYVINLGSIPLHLWSSRISDLQHPDWCILDLDPKEAPFEHVIRLARAARALCREIELECYVKTSGSTGLHVLLPLGGMFTYEQSRKLGEILARILVTRLPDISTITRNPSKRSGKVYIDFVQNGHGRLLVAPFCVRPLPGAPVSTPLRWSEVKKGLDIRKHTIGNVPERLRRMKTEPLRPVMTDIPDLERVLERLMDRLSGPEGGSSGR